MRRCLAFSKPFCRRRQAVSQFESLQQVYFQCALVYVEVEMPALPQSLLNILSGKTSAVPAVVGHILPCSRARHAGALVSVSVQSLKGRSIFLREQRQYVNDGQLLNAESGVKLRPWHLPFETGSGFRGLSDVARVPDGSCFPLAT